MGLIGKLSATDQYNSYSADMNEVYFKVEGVFIDTDNENVRICVRGWMNEFARHNQGIGIFKRVLYVPIEFFNETPCTKDALITKAYNYLKGITEFNSCKDAKEYKGKILITKEIKEKQKKNLDEMIAELKK